MKMFKISVDGFPDGYYSAENAKKAKFRVWKAAQDCGYKIGFNEIQVVPAPEFNCIAKDKLLQINLEAAESLKHGLH